MDDNLHVDVGWEIPAWVRREEGAGISSVVPVLDHRLRDGEGCGTCRVSW